MSESSASGPAGVPVSRALDLAEGIANDDFRHALRAINSVHGDGQLPPIPVILTGRIDDPRAANSDAIFSYDDGGGGTIVPFAIMVKATAPNRQFVLLHEIGHFLDLSGFPGEGFSSTHAPELREWRRAARRSLAYRILSEQRDLDDDHRAVLRTFEELWARSCAQFIAVRSQSTTLRASLDALRRRQPGTVYHPTQWDDDDFLAIDAAIADLFWSLGWRS
jgi:hypothetical protein